MPSSLLSRPPRRVVVKLGTGVITSGIGQLDEPRLAALAAQITALRAKGSEVIVVSSGAVGLGMGRLQLEKKPKVIAKKQAKRYAARRLAVQVVLSHDNRHRCRVVNLAYLVVLKCHGHSLKSRRWQ